MNIRIKQSYKINNKLWYSSTN